MKNLPKKAITVFLNGGLGNQLFGLAAGYALSKHQNCPLNLNVSLLSNSKIDFPDSLAKHFTIDYAPSRYYSLSSNFSRRAYRLFCGNSDYFEPGFAFDKRFPKLVTPKRLHGYFQSYMYFSEVFQEFTDLLLREFNPSPEYSLLTPKLPKDFIALHVRRGDYLQNLEYHGVIEKGYYLRALDMLDVSRSSNKIVVFTDDLISTEKIFPEYLIISERDLSVPIDNLVLMSNAHSIIGANSTFSLWAAFLASRKGTDCVFPKKWFEDTRLDTTTLMPTYFSRI